MFALKAVTRLVPASSGVAPARSHVLRYLSTEPTPEPVDVHQAQSKERQRSIRKVSEEGGAHSQLVALAVKNTTARAASANAPRAKSAVTKEQRLEQAKRQLERRRSENSKSSPSASSTPGQSRPRTSERRTGGGGGAGASAPSDAIALLRGNAERRPFNPRFQASPSGDRSPRPPRRNSPSSSSSSSPKSKQNQSKPKRRQQASTTSASIFTAEQTQPLVPPPSVSYPSLNLAQLLRADLASKALSIKQSVATSNLKGAEDSEDAHVREQARKVLNGDYSQWTSGEEPGKEGKGEKEAVQHAKTLLARNPSVGLEEREVFLNKLKEVL